MNHFKHALINFTLTSLYLPIYRHHQWPNNGLSISINAYLSILPPPLLMMIIFIEFFNNHRQFPFKWNCVWLSHILFDLYWAMIVNSLDDIELAVERLRSFGDYAKNTKFKQSWWNECQVNFQIFSLNFYLFIFWMIF